MSAVSMPKTVKVGPHIYSVLRKTTAQLPGSNGTCDFDKTEIWILNRLRRSKAKEILLHEVLHACTYRFLNDRFTDDEEFVEKLTPSLLQVLQDNPELVQYLTQ